KPKNSPQELERQKKELAVSSFKDIFENIVSFSENVVPMDPADVKDVLAHPAKFAKLNTYHQGQIIEDLDVKQKRKWTSMTSDEKRMIHYIWYGPWGPREGFENFTNAKVPPQDLPWEMPSQAQSVTDPKQKISIRELPVRDLKTVSEDRRKTFKNRGLDPMSSFVVSFALLVFIGSIYRDTYIGEAGAPVEHVIVEYQEPEKEAEVEAPAAKPRKWYYLWAK
ncbi:hypothetical protein BABINDRAFT_27123, partial [Babjeviella inositovora NRRL Y-12698]